MVDFIAPISDPRNDAVFQECTNAVAQPLDSGREGEIHGWHLESLHAVKDVARK